MQPRCPRVVDTNVRVQRTTKGHLLAIERDLHGQQFSTQKDQGRPAIATTLVLARKGVDFVPFLAQRSIVRIMYHRCSRNFEVSRIKIETAAYLIPQLDDAAIVRSVLTSAAACRRRPSTPIIPDN